MLFVALNLSLCTYHDTTAACFIGVSYALYTIYICTRREIWSLDMLHQTININFRIVYICTTSINNFSKIMRRHICRHTYSNTVTSVHKKIRNLCWHNSWLLKRVIEIIGHINSIFLKIVHDMFAHLRKSTLCITHSSSRVSINRAEVSLTIY